MIGRGSHAVRAGVETWRRVHDTDGLVIGAGVAFFALLSLVPAMAALVAVYGLFADPADVAKQVADLFGSDVGPGRQWVLDQLVHLTSANSGSLRVAAVVAILVALWSASSGVRHLLVAVDAALGRPRTGLVRTRVRGLIGSLVLVVVAAVVVAVLAALPAAWPWLAWLRYPTVVLLSFVGCVGLYRSDGSNRAARRGALVAVGGWLLGSAVVGGYIAWGPGLETTYGAFSSVVAVMFWLWMSATAVVVGAHVAALGGTRVP